jgi:DNA mismatch repair protein MutS
VERREDSLLLDASSRRNLELEENLGARRGLTLLGVIDRTATSMGSRLLKRWLGRPLRNQSELQRRHHCVGEILSTSGIQDIQNTLRRIGDLERILARVALMSARPRDLTRLREGLGALPDLQSALKDIDTPRLQELTRLCPPQPAVHELLLKAIVDAPPQLIRDGGVIATGYDTALDELRSLSQNADSVLAELEIRERTATAIANLKVGYNRVHGYYIEVPRSQSAEVPDTYQRRQTLKNVERYITPELKGFEDRVLSARERSLARERQLYTELLERLIESLPELQQAAGAVSEIDVLCNLAERAGYLQLSVPELCPQAGIHIEGGRHLVVEQTLTEPFVANDLTLTPERRMLIITGPNMGGKSTYMRQTALIVILAHIGSFVPAERAKIGPVDRIFTRIGAADDLTGGRSTFMVEMTETANILHNATAQSLVLMDEVGRGTSTFDGLSLAWACAVELAQQIKALTLFATHYFELTALADTNPAIINMHLDAVEHADKIVFMHRVREGSADRSYGLQVAALAGIPPEVINRARTRLQELETRPMLKNEASVDTNPQLSLFAPMDHPLVAELAEIDPDSLTPRQALEMLYRLRDMASN